MSHEREHEPEEAPQQQPAAPLSEPGKLSGPDMSASSLLALQASAGNAAVTGLIQGRWVLPRAGAPRCACGAPAGPDGTCQRCRADDGGGAPVARTPRPPAASPGPQLARKRCACGGIVGPDGECDQCRAKRLAGDAGAGLAPVLAKLARQESEPPVEGDEHGTGALVVDDDAQEVQPQQMKRLPFLRRLRAELTAGVEDADPSLMDAALPKIDEALTELEGADARAVETSVRRQAGAEGAESADDLLAAARRQSADTTRRGPAGGLAGALGGAARFLGGLFRKAHGGIAAADADPGDVHRQLGEGQPLDGRTRSGMETAFGRSFGDVRVHTDSTAARLSRSLNARAFAVGRDIAFAPGEYKPGNPIGDALIAHELAHVAQQDAGLGSAEPLAKGASAQDASVGALEHDADVSAVHAVVHMWTGGAHAARALARRAMPRLRSGLALQRSVCGTGDCPPGYCWQVVDSGAGVASCNCYWACRPEPTSGPVLRDPNAPRPWIPTDRRIGGGAMFAHGGITTPGCGCLPIEGDRGAVCPPPLVSTPSSNFRSWGGGVAGLGNRPQPGQTRDPRERPAIIGPPTPGGGRAPSPGPTATGGPPTPAPAPTTAPPATPPTPPVAPPAPTAAPPTNPPRTPAQPAVAPPVPQPPTPGSSTAPASARAQIVASTNAANPRYLTIHAGQQGKHVPTHNNFTPGRSELTHANPQALLTDRAFTGTPLRGSPGQPGFRERIDFGEPIGVYVDPTAGTRATTSVGIVHYSSTGAHIVPARPAGP